MKYLIDTHILIWIFSDSSKLTENIINILNSPENKIFVCPLSFWEISIKESIGKFKFPGFDTSTLTKLVEKAGLQIFEIAPDDFLTYSTLPQLAEHKDPFDRMLIHTAIKHKIPIISKDTVFEKYKEFGLSLINS